MWFRVIWVSPHRGMTCFAICGFLDRSVQQLKFEYTHGIKLPVITWQSKIYPIIFFDKLGVQIGLNSNRGWSVVHKPTESSEYAIKIRESRFDWINSEINFHSPKQKTGINKLWQSDYWIYKLCYANFEAS